MFGYGSAANGGAGERDLEVAVVGGAVAGLAAAERLRSVADVTLFERQPYEDKRVNCGEALNDASLVPLERTPENGFHNDVDGFELRIHDDDDHGPAADPLTACQFGCPEGYIVDRDVLERRWAERLRGDVDVRDGEPVSAADVDDLAAGFDYVVDATGQPALSKRAADETDAYTGRFVALNADVEGEFGEWWRRPRVVFEGYTGYWWSFPKSPTRTNVGIGWTEAETPDDYFGALRAACERMDHPVPDRSATQVYTIPQGPSLDPGEVYDRERGIFLVGDAAGTANRYQGEGMVQAIESAYLLADLLEAGREDDYPTELYRSMLPEYRLANLMRGVWEEHRDTRTLATVADAIDGLTIEDITRNPRRVVGRLVRHPTVAARVVGQPTMVRRLVDTYRGNWEYTAR